LKAENALITALLRDNIYGFTARESGKVTAEYFRDTAQPLARSHRCHHYEMSGKTKDA
jgi:hypothetical protein